MRVAAAIDSQSVKSVQFVSQYKGIDGNKNVNGRKRHLIVDTLGLVWGVIVHAADIHDGVKAHLLVDHCLGYLERMKKILVHAAYKKVFYDWVQGNIIGLDIEFSSKPLVKEDLCLLNGDGSMKELLDGLTSSEGTLKTMRKHLKVLKLGSYGLTAKLF